MAQAAPYLATAKSLEKGEISRSQLATAVHPLPHLTFPLLHQLGALADAAAPARPRHSWAITAVAHTAAKRQDAPLLQAAAAWYLARAANVWARPRLAQEAAAAAQGIFADHQLFGWAAACQWQKHALPWAATNPEQSRLALHQALSDLENAGSEFTSFLNPCRLAYAMAAILTGHFAEAAAHLEQCRAAFSAANNQLFLGRVHFQNASLLRRLGQYQEAIKETETAINIFQNSGAEADIAQTLVQRAYNHWLALANYAAAARSFQQAAVSFQTLDMPLWLAQSQDGLGQIYIMIGQLTDAGRALTAAQQQFTISQTPGMLASNLINRGWLEILRGNADESITLLRQAEQTSRQVNNQTTLAAAQMHLGEAYMQAGQFQHALAILEKAAAAFESIPNPGRVAETNLRLAQAWNYLRRPDKAKTCLAQAERCTRQANHAGAIAYLHFRRAQAAFTANGLTETTAHLEDAIASAQAVDDKMGVALSQRLLAETLMAAAQPNEALHHLEMADEVFAAMGMRMEQAACRIVQGRCYHQLGDDRTAEASWQAALQIGQGLMPDIAWQAHAGLAELTAMEDVATKLGHYLEASRFLAQMRHHLWQPFLVDTFFARPDAIIDQAVVFAAQANADADALTLIEESKALSLQQQLQISDFSAAGRMSPEAQELAAEIRWLQQKIRAQFQQDGKTAVWQKEQVWRQQLAQKIQAYDEVRNREERNRLAENYLPDNFDADLFRQKATAVLGDSWLALDFYLTSEKLVGVMLSSTENTSWIAPVTPAVRMALRTVTRFNRSGDDWLERDLAALGAWLFPPPVAQRLSPDTTVLIAPHRQLHNLPWPALRIHGSVPLAATAIPVFMPSLHSMATLWQRPSTPPTQSGLLLSISHFNGRYPDLPAVQQETSQIKKNLHHKMTHLEEENATWDNLSRLHQADGLAQFDFWHVAGHAFHDPVSGRLSGIALQDGDIWLEDIREIAPLPPLVVLSACMGGYGRRYRGDELVGLPTTCLMAGAHSVIASLRPVADEYAPDLMLDFYQAREQGAAPAHALAVTQRKAWARGLPASLWGNFLCTGCP